LQNIILVLLVTGFRIFAAGRPGDNQPRTSDQELDTLTPYIYLLMKAATSALEILNFNNYNTLEPLTN
jgi:hypothetical protein